MVIAYALIDVVLAWATVLVWLAVGLLCAVDLVGKLSRFMSPRPDMTYIDAEVRQLHADSIMLNDPTAPVGAHNPKADARQHLHGGHR